MRLFEKILIGIFIFIFILQLFPFFPGKGAITVFSFWFIALSYLIGSYWLLNKRGEKEYFIPIFAGLAFASSIFVLPITIRIQREAIYVIIPLLNIGFFIGLGIYIIIRRRLKEKIKNYKGILIRSSVILLIVGFFSYTPISFKPYRHVMIGLNNGFDNLVGNMQMFNYGDLCKEALEEGNCDRAIEYAIKSNNAGKVWLSWDTANIERRELMKIGGSFERLYKAYKCKADFLYNNYDYEHALKYYLKANDVLNSWNVSEYWDLEQAQSLNEIAICYKMMHNYYYADSLYVKAIETHRYLKKTDDSSVAVFMTNLAESLSEQMQFNTSNIILKQALFILQTESKNDENISNIFDIYQNLIKNSLQTDSFPQAKFYIDESLKIVNKKSADFCLTNMYNGVYFYKINKFKQADKILSDCLICSEKFYNPSNQNLAEIYYALSLVNVANAEYNKALENLDKGLEITTHNFGVNSIRYANYLKVYAYLDQELGKYYESEKKFYQVLETYIKEFGPRFYLLPEIYSGLAKVEIDLAKYDKAKEYSDSLVSIANYNNYELNTPNVTSLINDVAYVEYCIGNNNKSENLYKKTININNSYGLSSNLTSATSLNGLGLVMTAKKEFKSADSLFMKSLNLHKKIFTENHPHTAKVYLNYAKLKIETNDIEEAKGMLTKSLGINKKFFDDSHDIFADIYTTFGDIEIKQGNFNKGKEYYNKALNIYLNTFEESHLKIKNTKEKIKQLKQK